MNKIQVPYEFALYLAEEQSGRLLRKQTVGLAYLPQGHATYHLHLYTFMNEYFYVLPSRIDADKVLIMTREQSTLRTKRYFWHPVGTGEILASQNVMKLTFDLFGPPIYMSLFPEESLSSAKTPHIKIIEKENV